MKIVIPDDYPPAYADYPDEVARLQAAGDVALHDTQAADREELVARLADADVAVTVRAYTVFDAALLARLPNLKLIAIVGTGTDQVDLPAATEHGVLACNAPGATTQSVAELTIALMLAAARRLPLTDRKVRGGTWYHEQGWELHGKTLGLVGLGLIGQQVARMGAALGMRVIAWSLTHDPDRAAACGAELVPFDELLRTAHVLSLHLRATERTANIIGARELPLLRPGALLVNTARAALIDEQALLDALDHGPLAVAGLDVYWQEPLPPNHPLLTRDNAILAPHIAWVTDVGSANQVRLPVDNVLAYIAGQPPARRQPRRPPTPPPAAITCPLWSLDKGRYRPSRSGRDSSRQGARHCGGSRNPGSFIGPGLGATPPLHMVERGPGG